MMFMDLLIDFLQDHLHILLCIGAGCYLAVGQIEKRRAWQLRMVISFLVISAWMLWYWPLMDLLRGLSPVLEGVLVFPHLFWLRYIVLFALNVLAVMNYCKADFFTALFAGTIGYSLQHACERMWEIARNSLEMPVWLDRGLLILIMLGSMYAYGRLVVWTPEFKLERRFEKLNNKILLMVAVVVVLLSIVLDRPLEVMQGSLSLLIHDSIYSAMISFMVLMVSICHMRESVSEVRVEITDHLLHSEQERFIRDKAVYDAINIKCHDIRHQIAAMGEAGYRKQLEEIGGLINIYDTAACSGNNALDVILSNKGLACLKKQITLNSIADGRQLSFMADEDVYALFGNILDNAIDAVERMRDPDRRLISLTVRQHAGCLIINAENFFEGEIRFEGGLPVTSKDNKDYHGFGMQSICLLTERYGGSVRASVSDRIFKLSIMLPIPEDNESRN